MEKDIKRSRADKRRTRAKPQSSAAAGRQEWWAQCMLRYKTLLSETKVSNEGLQRFVDEEMGDQSRSDRQFRRYISGGTPPARALEFLRACAKFVKAHDGRQIDPAVNHEEHYYQRLLGEVVRSPAGRDHSSDSAIAAQTVADYVKREAIDIDNPKPVRLDDVRVENVYLLAGNHVEPLEISVVYKHDALRIPPKIASVYERLVEVKKADAARAGFPFFNGPNTRLTKIATDRDSRLIRMTEAHTRQLTTGREQKGIVLELGPVSWEEYTVLNSFLDYDAFPGEELNTIRKEFARNELIYEHGPDLRHNQLSNILTLAMTPITRDGLGVIQHRSKHGVSEDQGLLVPGVNENIHRFLDEAPPSNLNQRLNTIDDKHARDVDSNYRPSGVPSPLLTAQRGVFEELSTELHRRTKDRPDRYKFLDILFDFSFFQPALVGVIELDMSSGEVRRLIEEFPGKDHTESSRVEFVPLDTKNPRTSELIHAQRRWWSASLAGFVAAIHYWRAKQLNQS